MYVQSRGTLSKSWTRWYQPSIMFHQLKKVQIRSCYKIQF